MDSKKEEIKQAEAKSKLYFQQQKRKSNGHSCMVISLKGYKKAHSYRIIENKTIKNTVKTQIRELSDRTNYAKYGRGNMKKRIEMAGSCTD